MKEIEVKFRPNNIRSLINRIEEIGAEYEGEFAQLDIWFDNPALGLKDKGAGVRLRREDDSVTITLKHSLIIDEDFRQAEEIEFEVGDFDSAKMFLEELGFEEDYRLNKERKVWRTGGLELSLDIVENLGTFLELEGDEEEIERGVRELRLEGLSRITKHYGQLYTENLSS